MMRLIRAISADLRRHRLRSILNSVMMLFGVLGLVTVALIDSVAADVLVLAEEQRNGREPTYSTTVEVPRGNAVDTAGALADRLAASAPMASRTLEVTVETAALIARSDAPLNDPGVGVPVVWSSNGVGAVRRVASVREDGNLLPLTGVVINRAYALQSRLAVGDGISVRWSRDSPRLDALVVNVIDDGAAEPRAYAGLGMLKLSGQPVFGNTLNIRVHAPSGLVKESIDRWIGDAAVDVSAEAPAPVRRTDTVAQVRDQLAQIGSLFSIVGVTLLVVAAIGLLNVNLATVDHRARELAIRRAVGARRRDIVALVLGSSVALAVPVIGVAALVAFASTGWLIPSLLPPTADLALPPFPWSAVLVAAVAAIATSLAGAAAPAVTAARVTIADSLR